MSVSYNFPEVFDLNMYRRYARLRSGINIREHYEKYGKYNGTICSEITNKQDFVNLINKNNINNGIEIGPLSRPHLKNIPSIKYA